MDEISSYIATDQWQESGVFLTLDTREFDDGFQTRGYLQFARGPFAGEQWGAAISYCKSPFCSCSTVLFHCVRLIDDEPSAVEREFEWDCMAEKILGEQTAEQEEFSNAFVAELSPESAEHLRLEFLAGKQWLIEQHDPSQRQPDEWLTNLVQTEPSIGYGEVFPYAEQMFVQEGAEDFLVDDQYCVQRRCQCQEAVLTFYPAKKTAAVATTGDSSILAVRINYNTGHMERISGGAPPLTMRHMLGKLRESWPDLAEELRQRHNRLLATTAACWFRRPIVTGIKTPGRNEPCTCGSGKKYKKCCGKGFEI